MYTHCEPQKGCPISSVDLVLLCRLAVIVLEPALGRVVLEVFRGRFQCDMAHLGKNQFLRRRLHMAGLQCPAIKNKNHNHAINYVKKLGYER